MLQWIPAILGLAILTTAPGQARAWTPEALVNFDGPDGAHPTSLIADASGNLFGATTEGGANRDLGGISAGTVFEIAKTASGYASTPTTLVSFCAKIINFNCADGGYPSGTLVADANGNLFGTTLDGGAHGAGTVFEIAKTAGGYASVPTVLVSFCALANCADGSDAQAGLIADANGNLFGTTVDGGAYGEGTVFEIVKTAGGYASTPHVLVSFCALTVCADGATPFAGLLADANGDLFGTTAHGGTGATYYFSGGGTVFEIAKTTSGYASTPTTLVSFCKPPYTCADGADPEAGLIADANGNLFGTTRGGGAHGRGTVFEIAKTAGGYASTPITLISFFDDGESPTGLIVDANGNLFGTTEGGGAHNGGTVFEIAKTAGGYASTPRTVSVCPSLNCPDGVEPNPTGGLIADADGDLFGTTPNGGANNFGTVFESRDSGFVSVAPFAALRAALLITGGQHPAFTLDARFRLAATSDGINPPSDPVTLQIGPYTATIPAGSFRQLPAGKHFSVYAFSGKISNVSLALDILSLGRNSYQFAATGTPVDPSGNRMPVSLRIGYNAGSTVARAVRHP